jgi:hypothetical protein
MSVCAYVDLSLLRVGSSNLSFTATFSKHKPLIFLEKVGGLWFLASEKWPYGTDLGQMRYFGADSCAFHLD